MPSSSPTSAAAAVDEKALVRKMDIHILPWICACYLINYLDRTNLGNANTLNNDHPGDSLGDSLNLSGWRYNLIVALFFVPYALLEFPSNLAINYFSPNIWIGRIMITWGIVTVCTSAVTTFEGLLICRLFLGVAEAGFFPGAIYYFCYWYKPEERAYRMAFFSASVAVAGAFGGLIATGISYLNGAHGLKGWQWLYIIEGIPAIVLGVLVLLFMPSFPERATFLTPEERRFAVERMGPYAPKSTDKHFDWKDAVATISDPFFWVYSVQYFLMTNSLNAFGYFSPTIISALGFKGPSAQALTIPPNVFAFFVIVGTAYNSDRTKERVRHILFGLALTGTGYLLLAVVRHWGIRYLGVMFIACTNAAVIPFIAHRTRTVRGATATALATGGMIAFANLGGISAPFLFPASASPLYSWSNWVVFGMMVGAMLLTLVVWWRFGTGAEYVEGDLVGGNGVDDDAAAAAADAGSEATAKEGIDAVELAVDADKKV